MRGQLRHPHRGRRRRRDHRPARRRAGSVQPRVRLPQGDGAGRRARRPGSPDHAGAPARQRVGADRLGRGLRPGGRPPARDPPRARTGRHRRLPGQPDRAQPGPAHLRAAVPPPPRHQEPLLGDLGRPAAAHAVVAAHVRQPGAPPGPRSRPHRLLPGARRQPDRVERQPDDRAGRQAPARRPARPRRHAGRGRPAQERDRPARRPPPLHPARHRRPLPPRPAPHIIWRGAGPPRPPALLAARRGGAAPAGRRIRPRAQRTRHRHPGRRGARHRPRAGRRPDRRGLRPGRRLHPGVRRPVELAHQRGQRRHRQPRPRRRLHVLAPAGRPRRWPTGSA